MEIKKMFLGIAIDNEKNTLMWEIKTDYGEGFVRVEKTSNEVKKMLSKIADGIVEMKEVEVI